MRPSRALIQNITSHLPYLSPPQPLTVERRHGRLASSVRVNTLTRREPFEQNTGYTRGRGRGRAQTRLRAQARARACLQRQFVDIKQRQFVDIKQRQFVHIKQKQFVHIKQRQFIHIKQRQQYLSKFARRLTGCCFRDADANNLNSRDILTLSGRN
jgi:hypothetical protein